MLDDFHPAVREWFRRRFPGGPTAPQSAAWPLIATGQDVLVASPTGTGKTLTGFLLAIDAAYRRHEPAGTAGVEPDGGVTGGKGTSGPTTAGPAGSRLPSVLYVSPLRALATDVHENLQIPLAGIREVAAELGLRRAGPLGGRPHR